MLEIAFSGRRAVFLDIAESIAAAVRSGRLAPGERLPPQREVAARHGIAIATVTRGYAEAQRRGLVEARTGRGTVVAAGAASLAARRPAPSPADLATHLVPTPELPELTAALRALAERAAPARLFGPAPPLGSAEDREAGALWLRRLGLAETAESVALCAGGQHALLALLGALTEPGEAVGTEPLTDPSLSRVAALLGRPLVALPAEDPEAAEAAVERHRLRALVLTPNLANPTNATLPEAARARLAEMAERRGLLVVESDIYGGLLQPRPTALRALAPSRTVFLSSLSKVVGAGTKLAYVAAPPEVLERLAVGVRLSLGMTSPLAAGVATALVAGGGIARVAAAQREEAQRRAALAQRLFAPFGAAIHPASFHAWVPLPAPWRVEEFFEAAGRAGLRLAHPSIFAVERGTLPAALRVCLGGGGSAAGLEEPLARLAALLASRPPPSAPAA